jgi:hypothetical protein
MTNVAGLLLITGHTFQSPNVQKLFLRVRRGLF